MSNHICRATAVLKYCSIFLFFILLGIPLQVHSQISKSDCTTDYYNFTCPIEIHPIEDDFKIDPCDENESINPKRLGKIIIRTSDKDPLVKKYYTDYQIGDGKVKIKAVLPVANLGKTVYFRVIDPDDLSSYETDNEGCDNKGGSGTLNTYSVIADLGSEDCSGGPVGVFSNAVAEVELTITDRYGGDNYQVEASLDPNFSSGETAITANLVAWKRIYIEPHEMYLTGSYLTQPYLAGQTWMLINHIDNLKKEDNIIIFCPDGSEFETTIDSIGTFQGMEAIQIADTSQSFEAYCGVRKKEKKIIFPIPTRIIDTYNFKRDDSIFEQAFGGDGYGTDGGAFVEVIPLTPVIKKIPKHTYGYSSDEVGDLFNLERKWFENSCDNCNIFMMVSAANWILEENPNPFINIPISYDTGISQTGGLFANICNVFVDNITVGSVSEDFQPFCNEVFTHEIAHQFSLSVSPDHIDFRSPDTDGDGIPDEPIFPDHTYDGNVHHQCIMSYNNLWYDGHAEFDLNLSNDAIQTGCGPDYDYVPTGCIRDIRWDEILK